MTTRRTFVKNMALGMAAAGLTSKAFGLNQPAPQIKGESEKLLVKNPELPQPATFDRLPLSWYKATVKRLKERVGEKGVKAIVLQNPWNIIYFTGLFHSSTERPFYAVFPVDEDALYWYHPGLDRDLVTTWWSTENEYYFDFFHAEGGHPEQGKVATGKNSGPFRLASGGFKKEGVRR
jgi:Xaa-Pro dipeptidase